MGGVPTLVHAEGVPLTAPAPFDESAAANDGADEDANEDELEDGWGGSLRAPGCRDLGENSGL